METRGRERRREEGKREEEGGREEQIEGHERGKEEREIRGYLIVEHC